MGTVKIFDVKIPKNTFADIEKWTHDALLGQKQNIVAKAPSEFLLRAEKNPEFRNILADADLLVPDGIGVLWAAKYLSLPIRSKKFVIWLKAIGQMIYSGAALVFNHNYAKDVLPERLSGVEVLYTMLSACEKSGQSVYVFGARADVLEKSVELIKEKYSKLKIAGFHDGYSDKGQKVVEDIKKSAAALLIVALGSPEQEYWIRDNLAKMPKVKVAVGEGGSFDAIAGVTKRAPKFIQKVGLEWLWRGIFAKNLTNTEKNRAVRIWNAVPVFIWHVVKYKIANA